MTTDEFRKHAHELVEWMANYMENVENLPVKSLVKPGDIFNKIPVKPPLLPESFDSLMGDFNEIIMPGITHWQNPNFFAYFPANTSPASILAEMLIATLGAQCMIWETSPAAAELEEKMMIWLREMLGLPSGFEGVIQDSASTATLASILTAREKFTNFSVNADGLKSSGNLKVYCSEQTHSSVEKAVKISGIGRKNLLKISVREDFSMDPQKWMFTNFDCTAYFVKDASMLIKTFEILPEYLKTRTRGQVNDYRDWGVPLGRRFRSLKLWSVIRSYGVEGLRETVRNHIAIAAELSAMILKETDFEILAPVTICVVCFRYVPPEYNEQQINAINERLNHTLNDSGKLYLSHTVLNEKYTLRMVTAQTNVTIEHVKKAWHQIKETARSVVS